MATFKRLQEQAYDYLKELILSGEIIENEIYSETKLASEIGISRTPIRDALQRLSQDGFIDIIPSKGFRIHQITANEIIEIFQIRSAIEGFCTFLITSQYKEARAIETISKLKHLLDKQKDILLGDKNLNSFAEYDTLFHTTIVSYAQNTEFDKMFNNYMYRIKKLALDSLSHEGRLETTLKEHTDIFNNIANGCIEDIYKTTLIHMETPKYINLEDFCNNKLF
ncbi:GntR family transcriptional regulator [Clostridioides difficile]|uniref:GntR family transcriptional regulator n=3 Tax=Clostridioides difficile TaxID=1496 RepID=A0AAX3H0S9_CLODI|nr:GntR family transcriptional regulator [Clostridioides difficile]AVD37358.1 GntR family transcriptional regulator [Clostridioides difficile]AVD39190.1 GntR family transcriptional regulator [Clostridioides difficile]AVD42710.1 GntR family transcriptional regulator [Clostridioides difficile]AXU69291.1 GntR family transcriptional regulator [Clostridioides difficile]AXU91424.1 GntR family transcriptional regulator [Clostridioides difficile]